LCVGELALVCAKRRESAGLGGLKAIDLPVEGTHQRELGIRADMKNLEEICSARVSREGKETVYGISETEEKEVLDDLVVDYWCEWLQWFY